MEHSTVPSLVEYLAQIPEYRAARGTRHPLLPMLLLVCVAMLCGARSQSAIAEWGANHGQPWLGRLGFTRERGPSQPTLSRLFRRIAHKTLEAALGRWAEQALRLCPPPPGALEGVAVDGKALRGSKRRGAADAQLLAAFSHRRGVVLGQLGVPDKTNAIGAVGALLLALVLEGRVVTADALLTQRALAQAILDGGGDDRFVVKEHQPTLHADIEAAFAPAADRATIVGTARTVTQHGGRIATRTLPASTALVGYSDWPGLRQVLRVERRVLDKRTGGSCARRPPTPSPHSTPGAPPPRGCWRSGTSTGPSRTSRTISAMSRSTQTAPRRAAATPPRCWPPFATPRSA